MDNAEQVIILHGLGRSTRSMRKIAKAIEAAGFTSILIDYPSTEKTIESLVYLVYEQLPAAPEKLHFVGHSLGGVLAKRVAKRLPPERRGRIVQLGAPNFGSVIAERAAVFGSIMGPALAQLTPNSGEDDEGLQIGAIAGTAAIPAYGLITGIEGENDGKVSVESAWGNTSENNHIAFPVTHSLMMLNDDVIDVTITFLKTGRFYG